MRLFDKSGEKAGDPFYDDYKPADDQLTDIVRWIDTDVMIADPLTKVMEPTKLVEALKTNTLDVEQCEEASQAAWLVASQAANACRDDCDWQSVLQENCHRCYCERWQVEVSTLGLQRLSSSVKSSSYDMQSSSCLQLGHVHTAQKGAVRTRCIHNKQCMQDLGSQSPASENSAHSGEELKPNWRLIQAAPGSLMISSFL